MKVTAKNLTVKLAGRTILDTIDFEANAGEVTVILGQNGSGKTTLTRTLIGELKPVSGNITMNGQDVSIISLSQMARMRAVLPQSVSLSFPFTVREVVRLGVEAGGGSFHGCRSVDACLARVGLTGYAARRIHELSGGEQQRVHLARVLAQAGAEEGDEGPRWLYLDEPVSSLDLKHQVAVMETARNFAKNGGGVIAVLHDLNLAAAYADKVWMLGGSKFIASGTPGEALSSANLADCYNIGIIPGLLNDRQVFVPA